MSLRPTKEDSVSAMTDDELATPILKCSSDPQQDKYRKMNVIFYTLSLGGGDLKRGLY